MSLPGYYQSTGVYTKPDYYYLNVIRGSPHRVGIGVPTPSTLPTYDLFYCREGLGCLTLHRCGVLGFKKKDLGFGSRVLDLKIKV